MTLVEWKSCASKQRYKSEYDVLRVMHKRQQEGARYLRSYWCDKCNGYHLTKAKRAVSGSYS